MRLTNFKIRPLGFENFEKFTKDEVWNGWDCLYLDFEQENNILRCCNKFRSIIAQELLACYDLPLDAFVFSGEDDLDVFAIFIEDGKNVIPSEHFAGRGKTQNRENDR